MRTSAVRLTATLPAELASPQRVEARSEPPSLPARPQASGSPSTPSSITQAGGFSRTAAQERKEQELAKFDRLFVSVDVTAPKFHEHPRVVATDGERIYLYRLESGIPKEEARYSPSKRGQVLSVQFASLGAAGAHHVVVNQQIRDVGVSSLVLAVEEKSLRLLSEETTYILLAVDEDGDGLKETLWGQRYDVQTFFARGSLRRLLVQKDRLVESGTVEVPENFRATGAALATLGETGGRHLVFIDSQRFLQIARGREIIWSSPERVGGSQATAEVIKSLSGGVRLTERVSFEPNLYVADLDGDGVDEVLLPRNVSPAGSFLNVGNFIGATGGEVLVLYRQGAGFSLRPLTAKLSGLVSGVGVTGKDPYSLFVVVARANFPPLSGGKSQFLLSETAQPGK
jgi:hypothetical protein